MTRNEKSAYQRDLDALFDMYFKAQYYRADLTPLLLMFSEREILPSDQTRQASDNEFPKILEEERTIFKNQQRSAEKNKPKTEDEKNFGRLHPVTILGEMIGNLNFSEKTTGIFLDALRKSFPIDRTTGYYAKKTMPAIVGLAHLHAKQTDMPVTLVEGDMANLSGANNALGRKLTDRLVHEIARVAKERFEPSAVELHAVRQGGDELRLVLYGLNQQQTQEILDKDIHPRINKLMAQYGAHNIAHAKQGDKKVPGFGAAFACVQLDEHEHSRPNIVREKMNERIELQKFADGMFRAGFVADKEGNIDQAVEHYLKNIYEPLLDAADVKGEKRRERIDARRARMHRSPGMRKLAMEGYEQWQALISQGGLWHDDYERFKAEHPQDAGNPNAFLNSFAPATKEEQADKIMSLHLEPKIPVEKRVPCYGEEVLPGYKAPMDPADRRFRQVLSALEFKRLANLDPTENGPLCQWNPDTNRVDWLVNLNEEEKKRGRELRLAFDISYNLLDARDPSSFAKSDDLMVPDSEAFVKAHGGAKVLVLEMKPLNGMNVISRDLADTALSATRKIIEKVVDEKSKGLAGDLSGHIFHIGNGHFFALFPPNYSDTSLRNIEMAVDAAANLRIGRQDIIEFYKNPNGIAEEEQHSSISQGRLQLSLDEIRAKEFKGKALEIASGIERVRAEEAKKTRNEHVIIRTMLDIPSPKEPAGPRKDRGNFRFGVSSFKAAIGPDEDVVRKLFTIKRQATEHFDKIKQSSSRAIA